MNKSKLLLVLPLLLNITSCGEPKVDIKANIINAILDGVNIKVSGTQSTLYPSGYEYLNEVKTINVDRDYKLILEDDGSKTPAVRENTNHSFKTYFKGNEGQVVSELYTADNQVTTSNFLVGGQRVTFNEYFANPFEYIDDSDIGDDYSLLPLKAQLILSSYTGLNHTVKEAKFVIEDGVATELKLDILDRYESMVTSDGYLDIYYSLDLDIKFSYDVTSLTHLTPRDEADDALKTAFNNVDNYTLTFSSDELEDTCIVYVSDEAVFIHSGINDIGVKKGDEYYLKCDDGKYDLYTYNATQDKFVLKNFDIDKKSFLPNLNTLSPNILVKSSENVYLFDSKSAPHGLEKMILPKFASNLESGYLGTLTLENDHFSTLYAQFGEVTPITITQNYYNFGTTSMPDWLDVSSI